MNKKNTPYFFGLIFCVLTIIVNIYTMLSNSTYSIASIVLLFSVLFSVIYCFKYQKIFIIISYLLNITYHIFSIYDYRNTLIDSGWYMFQAEIDELHMQNMISTFIFFILPTILFFIGVFIEKKSYRVFATIIFILIFSVHTVLSILTLYETEFRISPFSTVSTITTYLYTLVIWCKVGLYKFVKTKSFEKTDEKIIEKEFISVEVSLESLKNAFENGEISEEEYNIRKSEIMNSL